MWMRSSRVDALVEKRDAGTALGLNTWRFCGDHDDWRQFALYLPRDCHGLELSDHKRAPLQADRIHVAV